MSLRRTLTAAAAAGALAAAGAVAAVPAQAGPTTALAPAAATGERPLAAVLLRPGAAGFDANAKDYDVVTRAVLAVLAAKPSSKVKVLTDGSVPLTAFLPNDGAFRALVKSLTGKTLTRERDIFAAVAGLGIPTVEAVLLYHVVPGRAINAKAALKADGAVLKTAAGVTFAVRVGAGPRITLVDKDPNAADPQVILSQTNINAANTQLAHGINAVLRPVDLPPTHSS